ncbi:MAG: alpha/beta fold hydrolase [Myxococcota bacterium]
MASLPHAFHGQGNPLVLISGLGGKGTHWQPFLDAAARSHRVLTFDNRGAGVALPPRPGATIRDFALDLLELLDDLGLERASFAGRSMGGMIAQELALLAPERVDRLVLVSTTGRVDRHLASLFLLWAKMAESGVSAQIRHESSMLWCLGREALESDRRAQAYLRAKARMDRPADYATQARACSAHDVLDRLGALAMPTLVVAGTDDRLTPLPHADALSKAIPHAELALLPGSGHLPYLEKPDEFARVVLTFLERKRSRCRPHSTPS